MLCCHGCLSPRACTEAVCPLSPCLLNTPCWHCPLVGLPQTLLQLATEGATTGARASQFLHGSSHWEMQRSLLSVLLASSLILVRMMTSSVLASVTADSNFWGSMLSKLCGSFKKETFLVSNCSFIIGLLPEDQEYKFVRAGWRTTWVTGTKLYSNLPSSRHLLLLKQASALLLCLLVEHKLSWFPCK